MSLSVSPPSLYLSHNFMNEDLGRDYSRMVTVSLVADKSSWEQADQAAEAPGEGMLCKDGCRVS